MSYVLILNSDYVNKPPAVIGGYPSCVEAEQAGDLATAFKGGIRHEASPFYTSYVVVPGAGAAPTKEIYRTVHCRIDRNDDGYTLVRRKTVFGGE